MSQLAIQDFGADWVINADADEFWWPQSGDYKQEFAGVPSDHLALRIERYNFLLPSDEHSGRPFYETMILRERSSKNSLGHPLPPKVCHRALDDIQVADGNHGVRSGGVPIQSFVHPGIEILHFPMRSYSQLEQKIRLGSEAIARNSRISNTGVGRTWRTLYDQWIITNKFSDYYRSMQQTPESIETLVAEGQLICDVRIQRHFQVYPSNPC
jgi:hypothetical protein